MGNIIICLQCMCFSLYLWLNMAIKHCTTEYTNSTTGFLFGPTTTLMSQSRPWPFWTTCLDNGTLYFHQVDSCSPASLSDPKTELNIWFPKGHLRDSCEHKSYSETHQGWTCNHHFSRILYTRGAHSLLTSLTLLSFMCGYVDLKYACFAHNWKPWFVDL